MVARPRPSWANGNDWYSGSAWAPTAGHVYVLMYIVNNIGLFEVITCRFRGNPWETMVINSRKAWLVVGSHEKSCVAMGNHAKPRNK